MTSEDEFRLEHTATLTVEKFNFTLPAGEGVADEVRADPEGYFQRLLEGAGHEVNAVHVERLPEELPPDGWIVHVVYPPAERSAWILVWR